MGFEVRVTGDDRLRRVARALKTIGDTGLGKQMGKGLREASKKLRTDIRAESAEVMPHRGGYQAVLTPSLRFRQQVKEARTTARVVFRTHADGAHNKRDVPRLNRGQLRHPVYGRSRRRVWSTTGKRIPGGQLIANPWATTSIQAGFVDRPVDRLGPEIKKRMNEVIDQVAAQLGV